jgi:tetratricopeptide (TPR) repeat protein
VTPAERAALEAERDFLLTSIADLDAEFAAGDIDDADRRALLDGYTARAAAVLRALESDRRPVRRRLSSGWGRRLAMAAVVTAVAVGLSWWVAASSGQRLPGQQITGLDPRDEVTVLLSEARAANFADPAGAAAAYGRVLELDPDNVEALTYRGWTLALSTRTTAGAADAGSEETVATLREAVDLLVSAIEIDPGYADPFCFLGIVQYRFVGDAEIARPLVAGCLAADPPAVVRDLVQGLADELGL